VLPLPVDPAAAQQELEEVMALAGDLLAHPVVGPHQVPRRLLALTRDGDLGEFSRAEQLGQLAGIERIGLHPLSRSPRGQGGGHDLHHHRAQGLEPTLQRKTVGPRLVTHPDLAAHGVAFQPAHPALQGPIFMLHRADLRLSLP
jgi:hypothetical protein